MYGVIVCPKCKRPQAVRLPAKTRTCQCGKRIILARTRILHSTDEPRELPEVLGRLRAQLSGRMEEFEGALQAGAALETKGYLSRREREKIALETLRDIGEKEGSFDRERAETELKDLGLEPELLETFLRENVLYEVRLGHYRVV